MFVRASKRTLYRDAYKQSSSSLELLNLPFLCPALFGQSHSARKDSTNVRAASSKPHLGPSYTRSGRSPASKTPSHRRKLASAAAAIQYEPELDAHIPWAEPPVTSFNYQPSFDGAGISTLRRFDPNTHLLLLNDTLARYPKKFRVKDSITGDLNELHQNLHACLQVGRLERAASLLRRLNDIYNADAAGLLSAHSDYVRELTNKIVQTQDQQLLKDLQRWFEVDLKRVGVIPNAEIYAQMIRASSQSSDASRERTMRRYHKLADEAGLHVEMSALLELNTEEPSPVCKCAFLSKLVTNSRSRLLLRASMIMRTQSRLNRRSYPRKNLEQSEQLSVSLRMIYKPLRQRNKRARAFQRSKNHWSFSEIEVQTCSVAGNLLAAN